MLLFTSETCTPCKTIKQHLDEVSLPVQLVDIGTTDGVKLAREYKVRSVPTLVDKADMCIGLAAILKHFKENYE